MVTNAVETLIHALLHIHTQVKICLDIHNENSCDGPDYHQKQPVAVFALTLDLVRDKLSFMQSEELKFSQHENGRKWKILCFSVSKCVERD